MSHADQRAARWRAVYELACVLARPHSWHSRPMSESEVRCYYHRPQLNCQTVVACQGRGSHFCRLPTLNIIKARPPPTYRGW